MVSRAEPAETPAPGTRLPGWQDAGPCLQLCQRAMRRGANAQRQLNTRLKAHLSGRGAVGTVFATLGVDW